MPRRLAIKLLAALTAFGAVFAMAATLSVSSNDLGAGTQTVAACDTSVTADYPTPSFNDATDNYEISSVTIGDIDDACVGQSIAVTLQDGSNVTLSSSGGSDTVAADLDLTPDNNTATVNLAAAVDAEAVATVHVTIAE